MGHASRGARLRGGERRPATFAAANQTTVGPRLLRKLVLPYTLITTYSEIRLTSKVLWHN